MNRRLTKSPTERVISGVAGGVAEYLDADPAIVRVIWALLAIITGGVFLIIYIVMWIVVPEGAPGSAPTADGGTVEGQVAGQAGAASPSAWNAQPLRRHRRGSGIGSWVVGLFLIGLGGYFLAQQYLPWFNTDRLWPFVLVALGILLLIASLRRRPA